MSNFFYLLLLSTLLVAQPSQQMKQPPRFEDYPLNEVFKEKPATPIIDRGNALWTHRTQVRIQSQEGPNFAGHFKIAHWGCGTDCMGFGVIDLKIGKVFRFPFEALFYPTFPEQDEEFRAMKFKKDSRIVIADSCPNCDHDPCGTYFYILEDDHFKLIDEQIHPKNQTL